MNERVLIVIDPLRRYTVAGAPFEAEGGPSIVTRIGVAVARARAGGIPVIWTTRSSRPQVGMGARTTARYGDRLDAFAGDWAAIDERLDVRGDDVVIDKPRHSAFFATDLDSVLRQWGVREILISGFTVNVCCYATAVDAVAHDYGAVLLEDLCGARATVDPVEGSTVEAGEVMRMTRTLFEYSLGTVSTSEREIPGAVA